jgi:LuxR family transcriptional regulator, quorum-sensing system regulator BjaR1
MVGPAQSFGREAFEFIDGLNRLSSTAAVADAMARTMADLGFEALFIGGGHRHHPNLGFSDLLLAVRCPPEFQAIYHTRDYIRVDPFLRRAMGSAQPFTFATCALGIKDGMHVPDIVSLMEDFRLMQGIVIPIHGPCGYEAAIGLSGHQPRFPQGSKPSLHLMALYAYERIEQLADGSLEPPAPLTSREREVLAWAAQGKSAWETGEILKVAKRTVDEHALKAMRKLGAANRTQAVAIALRRGLFDV